MNTCSICGGPTSLLDVVDFNKTCEEVKGRFLSLSGLPIYYAYCDDCHFTYSPSMYGWSRKELAEYVYNDDYVKIDPDYKYIRPENSAKLVETIFGSAKSQINHLDYGGGNGVLSRTLKSSGWQSDFYEPFSEDKRDVLGRNHYDLITAFEVFEHVQDPNELMNNLAKISHEYTLILFTTKLSDGNINKNDRINWWYCAPRNGHISLFSRRSLEILASRYSYHFGSFNDNLHLFFRSMPDWASHINIGPPPPADRVSAG